MAKSDFQIPSLFSPRIWKVRLDAGNANWEQLWKPWRDEGLIDGQEKDRAIKVGQSETVSGNAEPERFDLPIARSTTHHERPAGENSPPNVYKMWIRSGDSSKLQYGIYQKSKAEGRWLQLLPSASNLGKGDYAEFPHAAGLAPHRLQPNDLVFRFESHAFFHSLEAGTPVQPWYLLTRTQWHHEAQEFTSPASAFDALNFALRETRGTHFSARPFHGLVPSLHPVDKGFDPLSLVELPDRTRDGLRSWGTRLLRIDLGQGAAGNRLDARFDWYYPERDGATNARTGFALRGKIHDDKSAQFSRIWGKTAEAVFKTFDDMLSAWQAGEKMKAEDGLPPIVDFKLHDCSVVDTGWLRFGSLEIYPMQIQDANCVLTFIANGHVGTGATGIYPEVTLANLKCRVRNASGADSERETARVDEANEKIDRLGRETTPIVGKINDTDYRDAVLMFETKYEWGRDAHTRMVLTVDMVDTQSGAAVWLNLRPFMAALVDFAKPDKSHIVITWDSDTDGGQWRVDNPIVSVILPPQAVGEAMERGERFYDKPGMPDIRSGDAVQYRFSRGTYLKLKPSPRDENRRYEISPINLREVMRDSSIEHMIVEMAYPLEVEYTHKNGSRELRLVEAGESFGKPAQTIVERTPGDWLSEGIKAFLSTLSQPSQDTYLASLDSLQGRQKGVQVNFQSRLAELHVVDPLRSRKDLRLGGDTTVTRLRHTGRGAKPLISPLPRDSILPEPGKTGELARFLNKGVWGTAEESAKLGSIRAGLVHSLEFASELKAVLDTPEAVGTLVEALTLSALGATGRMEAAFDMGKTSFAVVVEHGQLSRLVKTRVGRIGALWNRAKHVVVYERSAARSIQFEAEQAATGDFDRWPILRKMEEYVEPIEDRREFHKEAQKDSNTMRFINASVFETKRIFVNGAWGRDLGVGQGYELPLWDRTSARSNPRFYPRPKLFLECHGEDEHLSRLWFSDPDRIFFYSSAEEGSTDDTDKWKQRVGVDFDNLPRMPVLQMPPTDMDGDRMKARTPADRELCTSLRFDLAVEAEGAVNLSFGAGSTPLLVRLNRVFISRSSQTAPVSLEEMQKEPGLQEVIAAVGFTGAAQQNAASLAPDIANLSAKLRDRIGREIHQFKGDPSVLNPCDRIKVDLKKTVDDAIKQFRASLDPVSRLNLSEQVQRSRAMWIAAAGELSGQLHSRALLADHIVEGRLKAIVLTLDELHDEIPDDSNPLTGETIKLRDEFISDVRTFEQDLQQRVVTQLRNVSDDIQSLLSLATTELQTAVQTLDDTALTFDNRCRIACVHLAKAVAQLEKLPPSTRRLVDSATNWLRFLSEQLATIADQAAFLGQLAPAVAETIVKKLSILASAVQGILQILHEWAEKRLKDASDTVVSEIEAVTAAITTELTAIGVAPNGQEARAAISKLRLLMQGTGNSVLVSIRRVASTLRAKLDAAAASVADALIDPAKTPLLAVAKACEDACKSMGEFADALKDRLHLVIDKGVAQCDQFAEKIRTELKEAEQWASRQADAALTEIMSTEASQRVAQYLQTATKVWDVGSKAASLACTVGELPNLHPMKFDIAVAVFAFTGKNPEIMMSPAVARLQEGGEALLESLGLSIPCKELRDRIIPDFSKNKFNEIFNKFAGIDLKGLFSKFDLPSLDSEKVKVSHGFEPKTRRAWASAKVDFAHKPYEELFAVGPVSLGLQNMKFDAFTGIESKLEGTTVQVPTSKTTASLRADWLLQGAGQALVTFREVAITYDGASGFDFDVSPDNIELHPSLKFITDIVEKLQGELPPAVQIEMKNGRPVGVTAGTTIVVDTPPDLGAVSIGPIDIRSSMGLMLDDGRFSILSAFSLGSKQKPIFVQITWLGGGCWLEARAKYVDGQVTPSMSVGLSVGATRAFNLANVAKGSFCVLLYCYIEIQKNNESVAIGLSITGSALIIGFVNANVSLLLEAKHSKGKTEGTGRLDVSVKISWFYTFRFKQAVRHKF